MGGHPLRHADDSEPGADRQGGRASVDGAGGGQGFWAPLGTWLIIQLIALGVGAAGVPLAAHWPRPARALAVHEMVIVQFVAGALLFPFLIRDLKSTVVTILAAGPMLRLAAYPAGIPVSMVYQLWACLASWLIALALWRAALPVRWRPAGVAIAVLAALGGPLLGYLAAEFGASPTTWPQLLPLSGTLALIDGQASIRLPLLSTAAIALTALPAALVRAKGAS